jgi:hypothetical protein
VNLPLGFKRLMSLCLSQIPYTLKWANINNGSQKIGGFGVDYSGSGQGQVAGSSENGNDPSRCIKFNSFIPDPSGVGLRPLACWDCGFESRQGRGCLSLVSAVCC